MLEIEKMGLVEMNSQEVQDIDGGFFPIVVLGIYLSAGTVSNLFFAGVAIGCTVAATKN